MYIYGKTKLPAKAKPQMSR